MTRHVRSCRERLAGTGAADGLLLALEDRYLTSYWLVLEASQATTWDDLDRFLRRIWVECCGHLSSFELAGATFASDVDGAAEWAANPHSMGERIVDSVGAGSRFSYEYDFGTTTELTGRALALVAGASTGAAIDVLARNEPPVHPCVVCGRTATSICALCYQVVDGLCWYCDVCSDHHRCSEPDGDYFLPVVNSPRVGLCGYSGPAEG
ncbi:MAG: hypothetical protein ACYCTE_17880 [Acidimicrobiales bacterium]